MSKESYVFWLSEVSSKDVAKVGGKNASLGEMLRSLKKEKIRIPEGFATTARAYRDFLKANGLEVKIRYLLDQYRSKRKSLPNAAREIRALILKGEFSEDFKEAVFKAYSKLGKEIEVAVRSSATAEDLPEASFAGQQETFLNISGKEELLKACKKCFSSLFTDRAIAYREEHRFDHLKVSLSVGIQRMVRADLAGSGVMFSIDTDSGFPNIVVINAGWGLGENVVQGKIDPDEYQVFKPLLGQKGKFPILEKTLGQKEEKMIYAAKKGKGTKNISSSKKERSSFVLSDEEIIQLAKWACKIEKHYQMPMDMEWAKDGKTGELMIVQARPETVYSQKSALIMKTYKMQEKGKKLLTGLSIGQSITAGKVQVIKNVKDIGRFRENNILVTKMTDPDWVPIMKKASGIITDHGGRTSHAAIVSRELGLTAIVGTQDATSKLKDGKRVTLSCAEGEEGIIYEGILKYQEKEVDLSKIPKPKVPIMLNIASPASAMHNWQLPCQGIGLARMEFIINQMIQVHPLALIEFDKVKSQKEKNTINKLTEGYKEKKDYFIDILSKGIAKIAASQYPNPVIVRMSDFKTNEYANLIGGKYFEPHEENPMIGYRGACRYYSAHYRKGFDLECQAIRRAREWIGLDNILIMIPFCRTLKEADKVLKVLEENGLKKGTRGLQIYVMCEIPSNVILAEQFADRFDGFSIGSNDLTQLVLGVDRDNEMLSELFDETNSSVKQMIQEVIKKAHKKKKKVGFCGQAPSDHFEFAEFLVSSGIDSISLNPDSVLGVMEKLANIK